MTAPKKPRGAPRKPVKRDVQMQFYTTLEISRKIRARASKAGVTVSTYIERIMCAEFDG